MIWAVIACGVVLAAGFAAVALILYRGFAELSAAVRGIPADSRGRATGGTARIYSPWKQKTNNEEDDRK